MEIGMISVDKWSSGSQAYFLTHLHSDHTKGLSATWRNGPLFCSPASAALFPFKFPKFPLSLLRVIRIGIWKSISILSPSSGNPSAIRVMPVDACHCPGAVMYLFHGNFGFMLYTGDFRWETTSERSQDGKCMLLNALGDNKVDTVYLDNTYCNPSYSFPSREVAAQQVVDVINAYPNHDVIIGIDSLGKEDLLLYIARALNIKIWVWPERLQVMHLLGFEDVFTTKTSLTRVRAVPRYSFSIETLEGLNEMQPTIGIMPSGLPWVVKHVRDRNSVLESPFPNNCSQSKSSGVIESVGALDRNNENIRAVEIYHDNIYSVPYSDHSCFSEIKEFVKLVQPINLKGIVSSSTMCVDPLYYLGYLYKANRISMSLHQSVTRKVNRKVEASVESETRIKRKKYDDDFSVGRATIMRRTGHGAKIVQID